MFQIHALDPAPFAHLFALSDKALAAQGARRVVADEAPGFPCRVSLMDASVGDEVVLVGYEHLPGNTPYRASHAIYVRKGVAQAELPAGAVPPVLSTRLLSIRGFDRAGMMRTADVVDGTDLAAALPRMFANPEIAVVHIHNAKQGCFAASATRA